MDASRIGVLPAELANRIAAGEVVERPASVVKELVENAVDAGATRVSVEIEDAGLQRIVVVDDGNGIHPDDVEVALRRHATSKVRETADLAEIRTLGFRGEALASIAAVADVTLDSRPAACSTGVQVRARPGLGLERRPVGMAGGTRVEVQGLFGPTPARRKFMRSEATEVGHCTETMLRIGIAHPGVSLALRHGARRLVELPAADQGERIAAVLRRKGAGELRHVAQVVEGVDVEAWLAAPEASVRGRGGLYVVVRRRVVSEPQLARIVAAAYGDALPAGRQPIACLRIDPPPCTVDVNVHPQKAEVRFADPQRVYAAARRALESAAIGWAPAADAPLRFGLDATTAPAAESGRGYSLRTQAASDDYASAREGIREDVEELRARMPQGRASVPQPTVEPALPELLTCLRGPVAVFRDGEDLLAVDLLTLRSHLVYRRLRHAVGGGGIEAQLLLSPVVVKCDEQDVKRCDDAREDLDRLGLSVEPFGDDAVVVRAVPVGLKSCVEEPDIANLFTSILPWLRMRERAHNTDELLLALSRARGQDPSPRLARRFVRELVLAGEQLCDVPGVHRWTAGGLVRK